MIYLRIFQFKNHLNFPIINQVILIMIIKLFRSIQYGINVYQGVSPALLATMSLANNIKGNNQQQLAASLRKAGLIGSNQQHQAWKYVDRKYFTKATNPYANKPHSISKGESMTDVFTQSIIVSNLLPHLSPNPKILDIGTGHGYLSFLICKILQNRRQLSFQITGIDVNKEAIKKCKEIHNEFFPNLKGLTFQNEDLFQYLQKNQTKKFDAIIGGYFLDSQGNDKLTKFLSVNGVGIWPRISQTGHGQALYKVKSDSSKTYILQTLFSMPVVRSSVDKYFVQPGQEIESVQKLNKQSQNQNMQEMIQYAKKQKKQIEQRLKQQLKLLLEKYRKTDGKLLTLIQMKANQQINFKMQELQKLSKTKIKPKK